MRLHSWLSPKCFVGESRLDGIGVFAKESISEGEVVSVWGGIVYSTDEIVALGDTFPNFRTHPLQIADNFYLGSSSLTAVDDAERFNHSCGANLGVKGQILVIARRDISAGEELTFDYETANTEFPEFECRCQSENCRHRIDGTAWQRPDFRKAHEGWMAWFIERLVARQQLMDSTDRAIEKDIIHTLKQIGFPEEQADWKEAAPTLDPHKDTLHVLGHPVMSGWERPYMRALAEIATAKGGRVLELGFGLGLSASYIQEHHPDEHVIIEMNHAIAETARSFAAQQPGKVTILEGFWQDIVPQLKSESFDGILFDTYPLSEEEVDVIFYPFLEHAARLLVPGGRLTYYSDEATWFSEEHLQALRAAGFAHIDGKLISVSPPADCEYWRQPTILAPNVEKQAPPKC